MKGRAKRKAQPPLDDVKCEGEGDAEPLTGGLNRGDSDLGLLCCLGLDLRLPNGDPELVLSDVSMIKNWIRGIR